VDAYQIPFASTNYKNLGATGFLNRAYPAIKATTPTPDVLFFFSFYSIMSRLSTATSIGTSTSTDDSSIIRRSWHAMSELLSPFSPAALAKLPKKPRRPSRYTRADEIPDVEPAEEDGEMPSVRDYHSISSAAPHVRVPKKTPTPVRVEGKVWFANERSM
jgi:hypothetical protein